MARKGDMLDHINRLMELNASEGAYLRVIQALELLRMAEENNGLDGQPVDYYRLHLRSQDAYYHHLCGVNGIESKYTAS